MTAGLVLTWSAGMLAQSLVAEIDARDLRTYGYAALLMVAPTITATWWPARRASRTDPVSVLRAP